MIHAGLVSLVEDDSRTGGSSAFQFLKDEFRTQYTINTYNVPVISLADGYCMGGVSIVPVISLADGYCKGGVSIVPFISLADGYCKGGVSIVPFISLADGYCRGGVSIVPFISLAVLKYTFTQPCRGVGQL